MGSDSNSKWSFINSRRKDLLWLISIVSASNFFILTFIHLDTKAKFSLSMLAILNVLILVIGAVGIIDELKASSEDLKLDKSKVGLKFKDIPWGLFRVLLPSLFLLVWLSQLYDIWLS